MAITVYRSTDASAPTLDGVAGSLVTVLDACLVNGYGSKAAAGWGKAFSGTSKAAYRAPSGHRHYLRVDDTNGTDARIVGYEVMTTVDAGTGDFPTAAQVSGGLYVGKSNSADTVARPWVVIADERAFYLFCHRAQTIFGNHASSDASVFFGELKSYKSGEGYGTCIIGGTAAGGNQSRLAESWDGTAGFVATAGHYLARDHTQAGASVQGGKNVYRLGGTNADTTLGTNIYGPYPDPVTGGMILSPVVLCETPGSGEILVRGQLPGCWEPAHATPGQHLDTFDGLGDLAGISFILLAAYRTSVQGRIAVQTSGNWR